MRRFAVLVTLSISMSLILGLAGGPPSLAHSVNWCQHANQPKPSSYPNYQDQYRYSQNWSDGTHRHIYIHIYWTNPNNIGHWYESARVCGSWPSCFNEPCPPIIIDPDDPVVPVIPGVTEVPPEEG